MEKKYIEELLQNVKNGTMDVEDVMSKLKDLPFEDLGFAKVDHHRGIRNGYPEVIYCEDKTNEHIRGIVEKMLAKGSNVLGTRAKREVYEAIKDLSDNVEYFEGPRLIVIKQKEPSKTINKILVVTGGTSDIAVSEEAAITAEILGNTVERLYDVGVAGIHRLLSNRKKLDEASVIIVVAGMEGALASVVGGLVDKPVIAVPTSVGYGTNFGGLSALLTMLNSCSSGVGVVNIDNGFGAAYLASIINGQIEKALKSNI